ncbi:MAG: hypothetical protein CME06_09720 [Gemmatimonadetes bacterium]|nr:hypothetical protein [Gemmatimonadota bacterium]
MSIMPCSVDQRDAMLRHNLRLDPDLPRELRNFLSFRGAEVDIVDSSRAKDPSRAAEAIRDKRVLLSFDSSLAEIAEPPRRGRSGGIVVFRLRDKRWATLEPAVLRLLDRFEPGLLEGAVTIVEDAGIERRELKAKRH